MFQATNKPKLSNKDLFVGTMTNILLKKDDILQERPTDSKEYLFNLVQFTANQLVCFS